MKLYLIRRGNALFPATDESAYLLSTLKCEAVACEIRKVRSIQFHRKMFALFNLAFQQWEPDETSYKGQVVAKNFDRFRKDLTILAGFGYPVYNVRGEVRMEAESLSFASMDDARFAEVYKAVLDTVWKHIMSKAGYLTAEDLDNVVNELMSYE